MSTGMTFVTVLDLFLPLLTADFALYAEPLCMESVYALRARKEVLLEVVT